MTKQSENSINPLISIIMAVYNRDDYIRRAVDSVLNQSYDNWELISVDDGSRDYSAFLLEVYKAFSSKIKVVLQKHKSLPSARNNGIKHSSGSYITFLDSDDEFSIDHLKLRMEYLINNQQIDLLRGGVKIIGNEFVPDKDNHDQLIHLSRCVIGATFFGKREVFTKLEGFREIAYSEDSDFLERAKKYFKIHKVDFPTYIYHRDTPDSITNTFIKNQ